MAIRKNVKRIDPRYFLEETTRRDDEGRIDEIFGFGKDAKNRKAKRKNLNNLLKIQLKHQLKRTQIKDVQYLEAAI